MSRQPRPDRCQGCDRRLVSSNRRGPTPEGMARYGGFGLCTGCRWHTTPKPPPPPKPAPKPKRSDHKRDLGTDYNGPGTWIDTTAVITPEAVRSAALLVCEWARDVDDARDLLAVCGLGGAA